VLVNFRERFKQVVAGAAARLALGGHHFKQVEGVDGLLRI
jgi:hypothetical protein